MHVRSLALTDFRNYASAQLELSPGPTVFVGPNGQGKTNLVEAVNFLATLGSHRVSTDSALVRGEQPAAIIRARVAYREREVLLEAQINRSGANRAQINGAQAKPRELTRYASSVLFAPEDLQLVRGDPAARRRFLDELLVQRQPRYAGVIADYERVLRQRSTLLKSARASGLKGNALSTLDVWDERLVGFGSELSDARAALVAELAEPAAHAYSRIVGADHGLTLRHLPGIDRGPADSEDQDERDVSRGTSASGSTAERFHLALAAARRTELDRGLTLVGPHRDELRLELNGLPAKGYASHGESWSFALALRLASAELLRADHPGGDPVLILDDVFAELDSGRRRRLGEAVLGYEQILVTAAVGEDVPELGGASIVRIAAGRIEGAERVSSAQREGERA